MAVSVARARMTLEGTLAWGSSLWPIAWRASSMMQKAAMVRESMAAAIFLAQGVGGNLGYTNGCGVFSPL